MAILKIDCYAQPIFHLLLLAHMAMAIVLADGSCGAAPTITEQIALRQRTEAANASDGVHVHWLNSREALNWNSSEPLTESEIYARCSDLTERGARAILEVPALRSLEIEGNPNDKACQLVSQLKGVERLWVRRGCQISDAGIRAICSIASLRSLELDNFAPDIPFVLGNLIDRPFEKLSLQTGRIDVSTMAKVVANKRLRHLIIQDESQPGRLREAFRSCDHIERITFVRCENVGLAEVDLISALKAIDLLGCQIEARALDLTDGDRIRDLTIRMPRMQSDVLQPLSRLSKLSTLRLYAPDMVVSDTNLNAIANLEHLRHLSIQIRLTGRDTSSFQRCESLQDLNVGETDISGSQLRDMVHHTTRQLDIHGCSCISDADMLALVRMEQLEAFNASGTGLTDKCAQVFADCKNLQFINLNETHVGSKTASVLSQLPKLKSVCLNSTRIDDQGVEHLASCKTLAHLSLYNCQLDGSCFAALIKLANLEILSIGGNSMFHDDALAPLAQLQWLRYLDLSSTRATAETLRRMSAIPTLKLLNGSGCNWPKDEINAMKVTYPLLKIQ